MDKNVKPSKLYTFKQQQTDSSIHAEVREIMEEATQQPVGHRTPVRRHIWGGINEEH